MEVKGGLKGSHCGLSVAPEIFEMFNSEQK